MAPHTQRWVGQHYRCTRRVFAVAAVTCLVVVVQIVPVFCDNCRPAVHGLDPTSQGRTVWPQSETSTTLSKRETKREGVFGRRS